MFTDNLIKFTELAALVNSSTSSGASRSFKDCTGASVTCSFNVLQDGFLGWMDYGRCRQLPTTYASSSSGAYPGVYFGTGSTPASKADYTLESPITSGLSISSGTRLYADEGNGVHSYHATFVVKNTGSAEINISEIGLFSSVNSSTSKFYCVLMERTVLDAPITIAPGETKLVTYKLTFNQTVV